MNLKIKCDTPKEQVLVLRKFKKLVPEVNWNGGEPLESFIPFVDSSDVGVIHLFLHKLGYITYNDAMRFNDIEYFEYTASDFLRDDWKLESGSKLEIKDKIQSLEKQLNELKDLLNQ